MSNSQLSVLIQRQAEKYGDRVALKYRIMILKLGFRSHGNNLPKR